MEIISYDLKGLYEDIDNRPFTGTRKLGDNPRVRCSGNSISDKSFSPSSMLGASREEYYGNLKEWGLTPEKEYVAIKIEGYGDVFDICIKENDNGEEQCYMSIFFEVV